MSGVIGMLLMLSGLVVFVMCLIGLFSPKWLKFSKTGDVPKRSRIALALVFIPIVLFAIGGTLITSATKDEIESFGEATTPSVAGVQIITEAELGAAWPFVAKTAQISCVKQLLPVVEVDGKKYGLTGAAKGMGYEQLLAENAQWKSDPVTGNKLDIQPISSRALVICK